MSRAGRSRHKPIRLAAVRDDSGLLKIWNSIVIFTECRCGVYVKSSPSGDTTSDFSSEAKMRCKSCGSVNQHRFTAEMGIHFPGLKNIGKPVVWVFPELVVCLDCGIAEFAVPEDKLFILAIGDDATAR